jgi:hypothetical protein
MRRVIAFLLIASGLAIAAAGGRDGASASRAIAPPTRIPYPPPEAAQPAGQPVPIAEVPRAVRRAVVADAARRFEVAVSAVVLSKAERVTWPDAALGCPEPGHDYSQAHVPGFRLVARTRAGELAYHTDSRGEVRNCAPPAERR